MENQPIERADSATRVSLLLRLRDEPGDAGSWDEFVGRYHPRIFQWCRRWGLQESDASDVCQNVLLEMAQQIKKFEYDPGGSFRSWLKTVTRRAWYDYAHRRKKVELQANDSGIWNELTSTAAEDDLLQRLEEECNRDLLETAMSRVKTRVQENTWKAFEMTELEGYTAEQVAEKLSIKRGSVYVFRARVQGMLLEEVDILDRMPGQKE